MRRVQASFPNFGSFKIWNERFLEVGASVRFQLYDGIVYLIRNVQTLEIFVFATTDITLAKLGKARTDVLPLAFSVPKASSMRLRQSPDWSYHRANEAK